MIPKMRLAIADESSYVLDLYYSKNFAQFHTDEWLLQSIIVDWFEIKAIETGAVGKVFVNW